MSLLANLHKSDPVLYFMARWLLPTVANLCQASLHLPETQDRVGSVLRPRELSLHAFIIFARFCHWSSINCWEWVIKEVLLSVTGTCAYRVFLWGEEITYEKEGSCCEPSKETHPGSRFWSWCLLQKMEPYLTSYCYVLIWFSQHLQEKESFSNLLIEFLHPPAPIGSTGFSPEKQHGYKWLFSKQSVLLMLFYSRLL